MMDSPKQGQNNGENHSAKRSKKQESAQNMDYAELMQMILQQSQKLEHVKNNVSESQDREQYMELIKQSSKQTSKFLTIEIGENDKSQKAINTPQTQQNRKKKNAFHRFHKRRRSPFVDLEFFSTHSNPDNKAAFHRTVQDIDREIAMGADDSELNASKQSAQEFETNIFGANNVDFTRKQSVFRFEPENLNQPYLTNEHFKDYILVDIPENICTFSVDSDDTSHRCLSQMSNEIFRIVDEREKHIQNLYEAGDFIGDYVKHQNNNNANVEVSSAKSECFGGSVHDQSQGQINFGDDKFQSRNSQLLGHKVENKSYTEDEIQEAAKQFGECYNFKKYKDKEKDDNYQLLSNYIFGEQENRESLIGQLKEKANEIALQNMEEQQQNEQEQDQQLENDNEDALSQQLQESAHNYFDNSQNQSQQEDFQSKNHQITQNDQLAKELIQIRQQLQLAYQIIQNEQKAKISLVMKLKQVTKELQQLQQKTTEVKLEEPKLEQESKEIKKETKNQYCQTMKLSDNFNEDYFFRKSAVSRRSSNRNYNNMSGLSSQKNSFRTDNPFEVFNNNRVFKSATDSEIREKRQSMKLKYQKIQHIKQNKRAINHPRASLLSSQNSMRKRYQGGGGANGNVQYNNRNYFYRNSERLQRYYEGQQQNSSRRNTQKDFSAGHSGKLYNSFQIQKDLDEHFQDFKGLNTQRYDHNQTMNLNTSSKYRNRNSFRGLRDNNYQTPSNNKIMKSNDSFTRNQQVKSTDSLKIEDLTNTQMKNEDDDGFKLVIPEENEEFFSQSPHASARQNVISGQHSQHIYKGSIHEKNKPSLTERSSGRHHNAPSFGKRSNRMSIGSKVDVNQQVEFPKNYNIVTNPSEKDIDERDDEFAQKYDLFDHRISGRNSKRSHKPSAQFENADAREQLRRQEHDFHVQLKLQKEQLYYQFNQRYSNAKKFWKTRFDELLREKKRQLQVMQQFNVQMQSLHTDHQKTKDALKSKESNIEVMTSKLNKQQAMIKSMFNEFKQFSNVQEPSPRNRTITTSHNDRKKEEKDHSFNAQHSERNKQHYPQRQIDEHRPSTLTKTSQKQQKVKSNRLAQTNKNSPYKHTMTKEKYLMQSFEKLSQHDKIDNQLAQRIELQQSAPRQLVTKPTVDVPRKSITSLNKSKKKLPTRTQISQERSPEIRREMQTISHQHKDSSYPTSLQVMYNQFSEKTVMKSQEKNRDMSKMKIQKMQSNMDNKGNMQLIPPTSVTSSQTLMSHHASQLVRRDDAQRHQIQNVVESQWNMEMQNRNLLIQEKNLNHQVTASQADLRNPTQVFSSGKQSSSISTKEYLRAYILSGDKKQPINPSSSENSFTNNDQMIEQRQSKTEVKNRGPENLNLNFQQASQESESYYNVITLPNDKNSLFSDRAMNMENQMNYIPLKNIRTPIVESEARNHAKELSQQKMPIKIQSAKMEKLSREQSKSGRLKVKGNIKEFINKQQNNNKANKDNQKQYSNVLHSETATSHNMYYAQQHHQPSLRDFSQDCLRLRNNSKSITRTYPNNNKADKRHEVEKAKSPVWQKQILKTQSPVIAQKQQKLQMGPNPYNLTSALNKSDKKISTSSQRMIQGRPDKPGYNVESPHQQYVKSKADYLYGGNKQHHAINNQQAYYEKHLKKSDKDLHKGLSTSYL